MPSALDGLIGEAERRAERVISVVRVGVGIALGASFAAAVSGRPADDMLLSNQVAIAGSTIFAYFALGAAAFVLSAPRLYRRWYSFLFVTADALFLHAGVYLAIVNTGITANYATALPNVWILPILVAIGAMRYSPLLQAYAMTVLVGGFVYVMLPGTNWNEIVGMAPPVAINPFFSLQPNGIRLTMLALAGAVLVVAVWRTRRLLREALEESRRRQSLTRYLPSEVARMVESDTGGSLRAGRDQTVVVLFVDIRDFTARVETLPPGAVVRFLDRFRGELGAATAATGGVIDKFIGDGALVVWGVPEPKKADAANAVRCAVDIVSRMEAWSAELAAAGEPPVRVGVGVHMGAAFVGAVGGEARLEFTVLGDTVNVAARVERATKAAGAAILVTEPVRDAAGLSRAEWQPLPAVAVRGRRAAVAVFAFLPNPGAVAAAKG